MSDLEVALALEEAILGGEPFSYPCGCFGVIEYVHTWNANWVCVDMKNWVCRGPHAAPQNHVSNWIKRDGSFITIEEWNTHKDMSEYVYERQRSQDRSSP